ncbi:MAG: peptide deformylase [Desulfobacteraceae bacterium]|nr:peptide deformylase [Desulfobacteraceae bacterium]
MTILKILQYPEASLLQPSGPVEITDGKIDDKIRTLIKDMGETMFQAPGVGLAAPQIGINKRIIVYDAMAEGSEEENPDKKFKALVNPEIIKKSGSIVSENEACLSVPDFKSNVKRFESVTVKGENAEGEKLEFNVEGIFAIIMQHEIDHLDGILFFERVSSLKRRMYKKRIAKKLKESEK